MDENLSSYLYVFHVFHMCFKHMTFVSKQYKSMERQISHNYYCQIMAQEIYVATKSKFHKKN
jgi:hypothetical protein